MNKTEETVYKIAVPAAESEGCYIYDIQFVKEGTSRFLRIFADREGGIGIDECEKISRKISDELDRDDPIDGNYYLEVSSPGIERKLTRDWHFEKYNMCEVDVKLYRACEGRKTVKGRLCGADKNEIVILEGEKKLKFDRKNVAAVSLHYDF